MRTAEMFIENGRLYTSAEGVGMIKAELDKVGASSLARADAPLLAWGCHVFECSAEELEKIKARFAKQRN